MAAKPRGYFEHKGKDKRSYAPAPGEPWRDVHLTTEAAAAASITPQLTDAALFGTLGSFAREVAERLGIDTAEVLLTALAFAGSYFGRRAFFQWGDAVHYPQLFVVTVSQSILATSAIWSVRRLFAEATKVLGPEKRVEIRTGPVLLPRDLVPTDEAGRGVWCLIVHGGLDGAWWRRSYPKVSVSLCNLWDGLDPAAIAHRGKLPYASLAMVGHLCSDDLPHIPRTSLSLASRVLWLDVNNNRPAADPPAPLARQHLTEAAAKLAQAITRVREVHEMAFSAEAAKFWLTRGRSAFEEAWLSVLEVHGDAQTIRIAMIFALLEPADQIERRHLEAAFATWHYCRSSAERCFGVHPAGSLCRRLLAILATPHTTTELYAAFNNHLRASRLAPALTTLQQKGLVELARVPTGGRPRQEWRLRGEESGG